MPATTKTFPAQQIIDAVERVIGDGPRPVPLHEPCFRGREKEYTAQCIDTGWVSSVGSFVDRFERDLAAYTGAKYAIVTVNGTAALHLALMLAGVRAGDEVIVPALTFVATANAVAHCGAIPHFADSEMVTLSLDATKLDGHLNKIAQRRDGDVYNRITQRRIAAIVPMHTFGHPVNLDALLEVARRWGLPIVEDAAESLGSFYRGKHTGTFGLLGTLSFNGNKIITTGGGGAILTDDEALAQHAKHLSTTAKQPHAWAFAHDEIAFNYRLPNLNAALGCAQLEQLPAFLDAKRTLAAGYLEAFAANEHACVVAQPANCESNYWLNTLILDEAHARQRDELLRALHAAGILARPAWEPMHCLPMYRSNPRMDLSTSESLARRIINLPSSVSLASRATKGRP
ncbi:MAG: LegC family aminotransferase [Phycisphaeraceae bacterium]